MGHHHRSFPRPNGFSTGLGRRAFRARRVHWPQPIQYEDEFGGALDYLASRSKVRRYKLLMNTVEPTAAATRLAATAQLGNMTSTKLIAPGTVPRRAHTAMKLKSEPNSHSPTATIMMTLPMLCEAANSCSASSKFLSPLRSEERRVVKGCRSRMTIDE